MSRWFRVYDSLVDDPKVQRLAPETFRALVNLWCLAARNNGDLPSIGDIAFSLRTTPAKVTQLIGELKLVGLIDQDVTTGVDQPHNWNGRQFKSDVSNERVKQHRQRQRNGDGNVTSGVRATPPETETETETERSPPTEAPPNKPDDDVRDAVGIYNQAAGRVGWPLAQRVTGARRSACLLRLGECGGIDGWRAAIERAEGSGFLRGDNDKGWRAGLDFFLQSKSFTKLMEGSYDDHAGSSASNGKRPHDAIFGALADIAAEGIGPREWQADPDERPPCIGGPAPSDRPQDSDLDIPAYLRRTA